MARKFNIVKINKRGGVVPAGDLLTIVRAARDADAESFRFGTRQQMLVKLPVGKTDHFCAKLQASELFAEVNQDLHPNIVSSFAAENVFHQSAWLREGDYRDIMDAFLFRPRLKINLVDQDQCFVHFFTGHLNFVSASLPNYWFLCVRFPKTTDVFFWPGLVYSYDIPSLCQELESLLTEYADSHIKDVQVRGEKLVMQLSAKKKFMLQPLIETLQLPAFRLPYYEGFNHFGQQTWLGIYRRNELFSLDFLEDVASLSAQCCITPWKSLIIKNIDPAKRRNWDHVLDKHRVNVRHASNELSWMVEDGNEEGLQLKRMLVHHFDREDLRTYGLSFAIKTRPGSGLAGSVVIRKQPEAKSSTAQERFDILYTKDFNPNTSELVLFRSKVKKDDIGTYLVSLCKYYFELRHNQEEVNHKVYREEPVGEPVHEALQTNRHQCRWCKTWYDPEFGDPQQNIQPGLAFEELPESYCCDTCGASKQDYEPIRTQQVSTI
jgi:rubredoxin